MNFQRIGKIITYDLTLQQKTLALGSLGAIIVFIFLGYFNSASGLAALLYGPGLITSSYAFADLKTNPQSLLILPATNSEKFTARWLATGPLFLLYTYGVFALCSMIVVLANKIPFSALEIFTIEIAIICAKYFILHAVFFLGAIYFRSLNLIKTSIAIFIILGLLGVLTMLCSYIMCPSCMPVALFQLIDKLNHLGSAMFWILVLPCSIYIAWLRFQEWEI